MSFSWQHMSHKEVSSSGFSSRRHFVQIALTAALRSDDDSLRESRPPLLSATRLATSIEALTPEKPDESASFPAASLGFLLRTAAFSMDLRRASEVVVNMISMLLSSSNWKADGQVHFSLSRLRKVAPTGPLTLRHRSSRCSLPRSQILRRAGRFRTFRSWPCSPVSPPRCVAASHAHLMIGATSEDAVGSSYHSQSAEGDLPAVSGL